MTAPKYPKKRQSLTPIIDKRLHKLLRRKDLTRKEEIELLKLASQIENRLGDDAGEYGADLPS